MSGVTGELRGWRDDGVFRCPVCKEPMTSMVTKGGLTVLELDGVTESIAVAVAAPCGCEFTPIFRSHP